MLLSAFEERPAWLNRPNPGRARRERGTPWAAAARSSRCPATSRPAATPASLSTTARPPSSPPIRPRCAPSARGSCAPPSCCRRRGAGAAGAGGGLRRRLDAGRGPRAPHARPNGDGTAPGASWTPYFEARPGDHPPHRAPAGGRRRRRSTPRSTARRCARELAQTWDLFLEPRGAGRRSGAGGGAPRGARRALRQPRRRAAGALPPRLHGAQPDAAAPTAPAWRCSTIRTCGSGRRSTTWPRCSTTPSSRRPRSRRRSSRGAARRRPRAASASYHRAAAQRTLKAVGTYATFARRGADRHLPLIPPTLARFVRHFSRIPEGETLSARLRAAWSPALDAPGPLVLLDWLRHRGGPCGA